MRNRITESLAVSCWLTAALLVLFGLADRHLMGQSASTVEMLLGFLWIPIGFVVRGGGPTGRAVGLVAGVTTAVIGAAVLLAGEGYFVGTITAMFLVARLVQNKEGFLPPSGPQPPLGQPQWGQPQYGQQQWGQGQPQYGQPQWGQGQQQPAPSYYGQPTYPHQSQPAQPPAGAAEPDWGFYAPPPRRDT